MDIMELNVIVEIVFGPSEMDGQHVTGHVTMAHKKGLDQLLFIHLEKDNVLEIPLKVEAASLNVVRNIFHMGTDVAQESIHEIDVIELILLILTIDDFFLLFNHI